MDEVLLPGTPIEVRSRFTYSWSRGFEVVDATSDDGDVRYRVCRASDHSVLPVRFPATQVRVADQVFAHAGRPLPTLVHFSAS